MDVRLPRLGEGADSGVISALFVKLGDTLKKDQPILELESEKAVASIPSPSAGTVTKIFVKEGDEIKVGAPIVSLAESGNGESPVVQPASAAPPSASGTTRATAGTTWASASPLRLPQLRAFPMKDRLRRPQCRSISFSQVILVRRSARSLERRLKRWNKQIRISTGNISE